MARYEVRVDLVGSSSDVEKAFSTLADAASDTADKLEESFSDVSDTVSGQLSGLADDGSTALSGIGDAAEESAGRITDVFAETTGKVGAGLDDLAGTAADKTGLIADSFDRTFGDAGAASEVMVGKVSESMDALVAETTEKAALISARLDEAFAKGGLAAQKLNAGALTGKVSGVTSQADIEAQLASIEALNKKGLLTDEQTAAARAKALGGISGGSLEEQLGVVGGLSTAGVISDQEVAATKAKLVGLGKDVDSEAGGIKSKIAGAFKGIGSSLGNFGLPFSEQFNKMGESIEGAKTKAGSLKATLSSVGQLVTEVGAAAVIGFGAESIHLADLYDTAEAQLKTAVKNAGESWDAYIPHLKKAEDETVKLGFNSTETAEALSYLTTATDKPKAAIGDLGLAMNIARARGISLSEASQILTKIMAGNTRGIAQFGLNLDIGSGKLHSIQQATQEVTKDQMALADAQKAAAQAGVVGSQNYAQAMLQEQKAANSLAAEHVSGSNAVANALEAQRAGEAEVASGQVKGAEAVALLKKDQMDLTEAIESNTFKNKGALLSYEEAQKTVADTTERSSYAQIAALERVQTAQVNLANAQTNRSEDVHAVSDVIGTLNKRFAGEAHNYVNTLPGQLKVIDAQLHNLGTDFGEWLTPKLEDAGHALEGTLGWFEKNTWAVKGLAGVVGGSLALAVGVFAEQKAVKFGKSVGNMLSDAHKLEQGVVSVAGKILHLGQGTVGSSSTSTEGRVGNLGQSSETSAGQVQGLGDNSETAAGQVSQLGSNAETAAGQVQGLGDQATETAGTITTESATMETSIKGIGPSAELTEGTVAASMDGMEGATDAAATGMDAAIGSTGIGAILIGLSIGATLLATHWKEVWGFIKEAAEDTWHFLDRDVVHPLEKDLSHLKGEAEDLEKGWKLVWKDVKDAAEDAWHFIDHDIFQPLVRGAGRLRTDVVSDFGKVTGFLKGVPGDIEHLFSDAGTWLLDAGKNLLEGLWKGVEDESGKVLKDVEGVGKHVLHFLTHPWEILSPSHATQRAGVYLMQGISVGVKSEEAKVLSDVAKIGQDVKLELGKIGTLGQDVGTMFMTDFAKGITSHAGLLANALAQVEKEAKSSAMQQLHGQQLGGIAGGGPGGSIFPSMTTHWEVNIDKLVAQNPNDMARQLKVKQRQANLVRT